MRIGILDVCRHDGDRSEAVNATIAAAVHADRLGFSRYWLAEHHAPEAAHSSPDILMPVVANATTQIRIGVAGVLLKYRSTYRVSQDFGLLARMFPGRIDLGLARASVPPYVEKRFEQDVKLERNYEEKVVEVVTACRDLADQPEIWMLSSGGSSSALGKRLGVNTCEAQFLRNASTVEIGVAPESGVVSSGGAPLRAIALAGICSETVARAEEIRRTCVSDIVPAVVGTLAQWHEAVTALLRTNRFDELILLDMSVRGEDKLKFIQLLSRVVAKCEDD